MAIRLLDCTLREAPLEGLRWGQIAIQKTICGLEKAGIEIIECGFLKNPAYEYGTSSFQKVEDIKPYLKNKKAGCLYVALVDYGRYDLKYLSDYDGTSIDAIRVCFKKHEIDLVLDYAEEIRKKGYQVCIQHVDTMGFSDDEIIEFIKKVNRFKPLAYSVVDTFGAMYQEDMEHYTNQANMYLDKDILLGFHAHNNLMVADANAQAFIKNIGNERDVIVDASLFGCGRSAGNAHTELLAQYLVKYCNKSYDIDELLDLIDTVVLPIQSETSWGYSVPYFISGIHNAHTFNVSHLIKRHNIQSKDLRGIIERLSETEKKAYDYKLLERLYVEYFDRPVNDERAVEQLTQAFQGREILLLAPGQSVKQQKNRIDAFIQEKNPLVIAVNNVIDAYHLDYIFYSGINRYNILKYQDYEAVGKPTILLTSNIKTQACNNEMILDYKSLIKFGWINIDSSVILLLRLLIKCGVKKVFVAGLDGYKEVGETFYKNELETGLTAKDRKEHTQENISMMQDIKQEYPGFTMEFLTDSMYADIFL